MSNKRLGYPLWYKSRLQGSWEDWEILGSGQGTEERGEYEIDSGSVSSWSSGYACQSPREKIESHWHWEKDCWIIKNCLDTYPQNSPKSSWGARSLVSTIPQKWNISVDRNQNVTIQ